MTRPGPAPLRAAGGALFASAFASMLWVLAPSTACAQPNGPHDPKQLEEARKAWEAGQAFYNDPSGKHNCEDAVREFSKAYELSGSVKAARARGICEMELEQDGAAIADYDIFLGNLPKDTPPDEVAQVQSDEGRLKAVVATFVVKTDRPNTRLTVVRQPTQGLPITNRYLIATETTQLKLHPGAYTFTAQAEGAPDVTWTADVQASSSGEHAVSFAQAIAQHQTSGPQGPQQPPQLPPADEGTRPIPVTAWIFGGVTVAALIPTVVAGALAVKAKSTYDAQNGHATTATLQPLRSDVITKAAVSDVCLGVTIAATITTTVFVITRPTVHRKVASASDVMVALAPTFGEGREETASSRSSTPTPNGAVMVLSGSF